MRRLLAVVIDVLSCLVALVIVFVLTTGGGVYRMLGRGSLSLRSVDNPLVILAVLGCIRFVVRNWAPWLGLRPWPAEVVFAAGTRCIEKSHRWASRLTTRRGTRIVAGAALAALALKAYFAWSDPGFYSGDDVEIHEMTLGMLFDQSWPIWDLRNALFPMGIIYPAQRLALKVGATDVGTLVVVGRLVVATLSTLTVWLTWRIAREWWPAEQGYAVVAALLVATTKLQIAFGSSELPRPVSTVFVLLSFWILQGRDTWRPLAAGIVIGLAAGLRFSESVFLAAAVVQLAAERRWRDSLLLCVAATTSVLVLIGLSDWWYWGEAFHSLRAIVDFTLVHQLSSRGYQRPWWYLTGIPLWTNLPVFALAIVGWRRQQTAGWWALVPLVILSALPHKEPRYLIPVTPFVCLLATAGLESVARRVALHTAAPWGGSALLAALAWGFTQDAAHFRLPRTDEDVQFARAVMRRGAPPSRLAAEQAWRLGGHLYVGSIPLTDLDPELIEKPGYLAERLGLDVSVIIDRRTLARSSVRSLLISRGYQEVAVESQSQGVQSRYTLWMPGHQ